MATKDDQHRPEDIFLDRYIPNASEAEREQASENLRRLVRLLIRVHERLAWEKEGARIRANAGAAIESESLPTGI